MTFDEYQKRALTTAIFNKDPLMDKTIWAMGIAGEAGEVIEKWKKIVAYNDGEITDDDRLEIKKELGDVVWYVALLAHSLGLSLNEVMELNVAKLADRKKRGVTKGSGDNR
ncbi:MAG: nucleoside triphosphate pyrophosphohydrolase family protein [Candidatus Nomurabacteria bacterium]|nr:nucleoside triphosphate pyrophosphohydrolase family protein [Candidatus Saccharibacteria bacterium]USN95944.1 MAG: nucleoside triphosphate pyrophosphohydrolase family protein [Candidatus Nomurabacteria bacterium]